jgi:hypothetical protein
MNHPLLAAASGVLFGCVLCTSAVLHVRPAPRPEARPVPVVVAPPVIAVTVVTVPAAAAEEDDDADSADSIDDCSSPDRTLRAAQQAYAAGDYDTAIDLAALCTDVEPRRASRILGAASCAAHDLDCLRTAYLSADTAGRQYLASTCQRSGIEFRRHGKHLIARVVGRGVGHEVAAPHVAREVKD